MTNTKLLKKKIDESGYKMRFIAGKIGVTYQGFLNKIRNETEFKVTEIKTLCDLLHIDDSEMKAIFFDDNVE